VSHLRIFGSVAYCHIPDEKQSKLEQTTKVGYLVGYNETSKAYRIYSLSSRKNVVRRDVKFMEDRAFRKSREMNFALVQQQGADLTGRQVSGSSTVTSTNISSREVEPKVSQQAQQ